MKKIIFSFTFIIALSFNSISQELSPYIKVGEINESIQKASNDVINALKSYSFTILGSYNPSDNSNLKVIAFTRNDLKNTVIKVKDRGALSAIFKVGLVNSNGKTTISYTNPDYILRAYLRDDYKKLSASLQNFGVDLKIALSELGNDFTQFGGTIDAEDLKNYHYKITMPYFTDPEELNEFTSFEEGVSIIENNLKENVGNTKMVYKLVYPSEKVAVFGIGLLNKDDGEAHFLPIIGEAHAAALPYEIILQDKQATILKGKYRIALHWPDLTMGTFIKIMSTPGDIEDTLEALCQ
jgi:hypothetical protein